jgi:Hint module
MSRSVFFFSAFLAFTALCSARPVADKIEPPEHEGHAALQLLRGLQEMKPLDLGQTALRSVDVILEKTAVRRVCSSAQSRSMSSCVQECSTACGSQCCATRSGNILVVCSVDCCLGYDIKSNELSAPTTECTTAAETRGGSVGGSGSGSSGQTSPTTSGPGGNSQPPPGTSPSNGSPGAPPVANPAPKQGSCFGAAALVELESGAPKRMDQLAVGDRVKVGLNRYSDIFMFTHKVPAVRNDFVVIRTASGHAITLTPGHFIYLNNALADSATAKVGDKVFLGNGAQTVVSSVGRTVEAGLYNPQTIHGDIVVNGVLASTYTTAVTPSIGHALLLPLRALYCAFRVRVPFFENGASSLAGIVPAGPLSQ